MSEDDVSNGLDKPSSSKKKIVYIIAGTTGLLFVCCFGLFAYGSYQLSTEEGQATATARTAVREVTNVARTAVAAVEETDEARPTDTAEPTDTPEPTDTAEPTNTPTPTFTPKPTDTPTPTLTPSPTPEPIVVTGSGDSLVDIQKGNWPALVRITGNSSGRHFAVSNYDVNDENVDLLVNTTDPYEGLRPLDFLDNEHTFGFEVSATGDWTIEVIPLSAIDFHDAPGLVEGSGDHVFAVNGDTGRATISGNADGRHFAITGWGGSRGKELLVNTTDPYDGQVRVGDAFIYEVTAVGDWSIDFE